MLKKILLLTLMLYSVSPLWAQTPVLEPEFNDGKLSHPADIIQRNYKPNRQELYKLCMNSVAFVKFSIGKDGLVKDIAVTTDTPPAIANALKEAVKATNSYWKPKYVNGKAVESDPFVMPLVFYYSLGCNGDMEVIQSNKFNVGMKNMLTFDDGNTLQMMKCTLLPAFITAAHN
ncbi:energy transducer TonB [Pontibacter cellulosilyticus]|uniref:TonB C-terminal domain-containing protein n=1 Tax=Pontibacter cellulosilyticus TaxID=1720253 RepID=A0A923N7U3_9BACT|nr:hypothetical protein [Pontibacter cellulosilyticus]MBC5992477.1 hypothetical protein [Pontibacter cellulosilyticus]